MSANDYQSILNEYWGYDDFRGIQREIIESIGSGKDTLGLMPTGGGKSITFQVPAIACRGVCIVITPLIALMKDQVSNLRKLGVRAAYINSNMSHSETLTTLENCIYGGIRLLYVAPERLSSELFQTKLRHMEVSFITVDEAHCISQWGYDFRPSYLEIVKIRQLKPDAPVLALTATATPEVVEDIQERLGFSEKNVFKMSFERKNLAYIVRHATDKEEQLLHILSSVEGSAIVYVRSRKRTVELAKLLTSNGISALAYNAGLDSEIRNRRQEEWSTSKVRVMVATNAFGMGIDKPDVRVVVHADCPNSLEAYFQEAGRAGRDGKKSYAVLLYNDADSSKLKKRVADTFPPKEYIKTVYEHLAYFYQMAVGSGKGVTKEFNMDKFCVAFKHFPIQVESALHILTRAGYIAYDEERDNRARLHFTLGREELDRLNHLSDSENKIITTLLRCYGGLFVDYQYINESFLAQQAGMDMVEVYTLLKLLNDKHILHFIPQKKTPYITYARDREDGEDIVLPAAVYDDRKADMEKRVRKMIEYAVDENNCRSRLLLKYFGEQRSEDCRQCDVCRERRINHLSDKRLQPAKKQIMELLDDGKRHHVTELRRVKIDFDLLDEALEDLLSEEKIRMNGSFIFL
ncbi:MAG: ATP-dependent DNA helicase RecQ [Prevotella sp.]|uniref:RecQ family ATP-dependent DNA helicase n=1 Tax=Prevotella sp. TaxID=59823 RepID=UPI002A27D914|nr:ATP-dependent DNA helicase RecQ [Prevotella sp.]MDD7317664.1 RecQ family ATP-dependent DNA helicase [Prevotellaceae bacterium]MDY4020489.1 ATP-dependent DNA helicase RecQ [Prevotella sp.]